MKTFLVGGAVRDILMGLEPKDRDYVVVGSSPEEMISLGFKQVGADFPVFLHPETGEEYALARTERKVGAGYHGFETDHSPMITLEEDLQRRDLTINSMAMDEDGTIIDPFGGREDLKMKILRHTSNAFAEDPVRILRIARFAARYHFEIDYETIDLMRMMVENGEFDNLVPERVWAEFEKGLMEPYPQLMVFNLSLTGALQRLPFYDSSFTNSFKWPIGASLECVCAALFRNKTKQEFFDNRIPSDISELSMVADQIEKFAKESASYMFSDREMLDFFLSVDLFRRSERFTKACKIVRFRGVELPLPMVVKSLLALTVEAGAIAASCSDPKEIKEAIYNARLERML